MKLEDIGINPSTFPETTHVSKVSLGQCDLFVLCKSMEEAVQIKQTVTEFFGSPLTESSAA